MDWLKGNFAGKYHIYLGKTWFPVDFPLNQSTERENRRRICHMSKVVIGPGPSSEGLGKTAQHFKCGKVSADFSEM